MHAWDVGCLFTGIEEPHRGATRRRRVHPSVGTRAGEGAAVALIGFPPVARCSISSVWRSAVEAGSEAEREG
jgi:hypothetical protein